MENNNYDKFFETEEKRKEAMQELLTDYIDTIKNEKAPPTHNLKKWAAAELIIFLAYYVGETHYEMVGILDECKYELRERHHRIIFENDDSEEENNNY